MIFRFEYDDREHMGIIKDISVKGFGFSAAREIEPGKEIDAEIVLGCRDCDMDLKEFSMKEKARIKWVGPNRSMQLVDFDAGCEFVDLNEMNQEKLKKILDVMAQLAEE
ncbi:hypothetical protein MTBBW1_300014 [Desulfamplus magnetovallimortis]|uniref:PilZ domain-containing protein n=1 Tax=Desulfamplus magnetovallimortis TaxID=1246637 RepID=A0A1W1HFU2_9BACT|nr:hypothetical protein MTBBW1_300014 [Desulfamplus magnetovallimortis]